MNKSEKDYYRSFSQIGSGDAKISISAKEVTLLLFIAYRDLHKEIPSSSFNAIVNLSKKDFYNITFNEIKNLPDITEDQCYELFKKFKVSPNNIIHLYLKNICHLYIRRFKYEKILKEQPFPNADQIMPRSLLEYGKCDSSLLASWLEWRKWIFDIDNRSAQETGYFFEPILASCLGGESVSHSNSPVKRIDKNGEKTNEGRQIDCYIAEDKEVYELKLRVTIAASGQGRFDEELSFPLEARASNLKPILVVFDDTPSPRLNDLKEAFIKNNGKCYVGKSAWDMLCKKAGKEMGTFINKYIFPPMNEMKKLMKSNPHSISIEHKNNFITIKDKKNIYEIRG